MTTSFAFFLYGLDGFGNEGEFLNRGDNNRYAVSESFGELLSIFVDLLDDSGFMLELVDGVLELAIEYSSLGNHNDGVKYFFIATIVEIGEAMS